jgi:hypothetical protein
LISGQRAGKRDVPDDRRNGNYNLFIGTAAQREQACVDSGSTKNREYATMGKSAVAGILMLMSLMASANGQPITPGTAGAANAIAATPGGVPAIPGTAPGSTSPGGINGAPEVPRSAPPTANPSQVPSTGPLLRSTVPPRASAGVISRSSRVIPRSTARSNTFRRSQKTLDKALAQSVDRKVINICKGC